MISLFQYCISALHGWILKLQCCSWHWHNCSILILYFSFTWLDFKIKCCYLHNCSIPIYMGLILKLQCCYLHNCSIPILYFSFTWLDFKITMLLFTQLFYSNIVYQLYIVGFLKLECWYLHKYSIALVIASLSASFIKLRLEIYDYTGLIYITI